MRSKERGGRCPSAGGLCALGSPRRTASILIRILLPLAAAAVSGGWAAGASAQSDTTAKTLPGSPLTVDIGPRGECQSSYLVNGELAGNFFLGSNSVGDCGFFLAFPKPSGGKFIGQPGPLEGKTFGFNGAAGPNGITEYEPVSQSEVSGSGTSTSPYTQVTVFKVVVGGAEYAEVTETTTYVNGEPQFVSTFVVKNKSGTNLYFRAIYAGDLYVNNNDVGTGVFLAGPPRFIGGQNTNSGVIGGFQEVPAPALPWSSFQEAYWNFGEGLSTGDNGIWRDVQETDEEPRAFNESIEPMEVDNGAGVEWDQYREGEKAPLKAGGEATFSIINRTQVPSGLQVSPANQTLTQAQTATVTVTALDTAKQPYAGKSVRYTISGANPQSGSVTLNAAGQAQISYVGHNAGIDIDQMFVDLAGNGVRTSSDPGATAVVTFLPPPPTPNSGYKIQSIHANSNGTVTIVFVPVQGGTATVEVTVPTGTISRRLAAIEAKKKCKKGQVKIKGKCRPATTLSGKITAPGVAGVPLTLTVKPSSKVTSALKKGRTVVLTAKLTYKSALGGNPVVQTFHFTIKPPKKHHH
jgi:hypothetical protein